MLKNWKGKGGDTEYHRISYSGRLNYHSRDTEQSKEDSYCLEILEERLEQLGLGSEEDVLKSSEGYNEASSKSVENYKLVTHC